MKVSARHVGGIRFLKVGRLCVSFCVTRQARPLKGARPIRLPLAAFAAGALMALAPLASHAPADAAPAACSTDSDCAALGGNGDPAPMTWAEDATLYPQG